MSERDRNKQLANDRIAAVTHADQVETSALELAQKTAEHARQAAKLRGSVQDATQTQRISDSDHRKAAELAGAVRHLEGYIDARLAARIAPVEAKVDAVHADTTTIAKNPKVRAWVALLGAFVGGASVPFLRELRAALKPIFPWIP